MKSDIQVGSKIKVVDRSSPFYRWRGTVSEEILAAERAEGQPKPDVDMFICTLHSGKSTLKTSLKPGQIECIQKKFIDIEQLREATIDLGSGIVRASNAFAFVPGDIIQISEKVDGANASIAYNIDEDELEVFSRTHLLTGEDGLRGFKSFIDTSFSSEKLNLLSTVFADYVIFGEWLVSHSVKYDTDRYNKWYIYDIWDKRAKAYLTQDEVKDVCKELDLEYIHALYEGPFISWDHCRSFLHMNTYGNAQEGIVVKNQTKLNNADIRYPKVLKIVNKEFIESHVSHKKEHVIDPEQQKLEAEAKEKMTQIVTEARVKKIILKCIDNGIVPEHLEPKHIGILMKHVPKAVYEDLLKEEPEVMASVGALAGKLSGAFVASHIKHIILG